jgi:hypothetical protein
MENVFEPMNFDGEVFEPMNFDGEVFEPMSFDGTSSDSVYFDGEEYSNFINFKVLKKNVGKVATAPFKIAGAILKAPITAVKSIVRKEPSVTIKSTVVPSKIQSILRGANNKPFIVTPLDSKFKPFGKPTFPVKLETLVVSKPIPLVGANPVDTKAVAIEVSKTIGSEVSKPSILVPSEISVVTESVVKDNNNNSFLISPVSNVKSDEFKENIANKPNVVVSINESDLPKPIGVKDEKGNNIEVATPLKEESVKPKEDVVPTISAETTPNVVAPAKSNKKLYIGIGLVALAGIVGYFVFKKK